jgi:3-hydroxyisobutyrate dehydrogenase-like beta-hydroxyacid dehydrogenase
MAGRVCQMSERPTIGLVGVGLLGEAFSRRLIDAGFGVVGFDLDAGKREQLVARGGRAADSVENAARQSGPILLALFSTDQIEDVVERQLAPILSGTNRIVMCASTCDPDRIAALAPRVAAQGFRFLETPVSGTSEQVRRGDGVGLIGGDAETIAEVSPILDALFPARFHIGRVGDGGRAKLAVNLVLGLNRLAVAEGLVFAERLGLDPAAFLGVLQGSAAYSQVMETKGPKMVRGDFSPEGRARQTLKDAHLMLDQARAKGQRLSVLEIHAEVLESCLRHGEGDLDNSVIIQEIRRRTSDAT